MIKLGITGGIGSGKSTVCEIFKSMGIPVYSADDRAKRLMSEDAKLINEIKSLFGEEAYSDAGELNRPFIASLVFNNEEKLKALNALVHPAVFRDFRDWASKQNAPYVIKEAALMFESESYKDLDLVATVSAPVELRIQRCIERDKSTREEVLARMNKQWSEEQRTEAADFIIMNDGTTALIPQVMKLHHQLTSGKKDTH